MKEENDIRWKQRFANYQKALHRLNGYADYLYFSELERQGFIQAFEYTFELAWNVMKDYLEYQGNVDIRGSRDAIKLAYNMNLISDGEKWMQMIDDRIKTSHTYDEDKMEEVEENIKNIYLELFLELEQIFLIL